MHPLGTFRHNLAGLAILAVLLVPFLGGGLALMVSAAHDAASAKRSTATATATVTGQTDDCEWTYAFEVYEHEYTGTAGSGYEDEDGYSTCNESYDVEETLTVHYDPSNPADHSLKDDAERQRAGDAKRLWSLPLFAIGGWLLVMGVRQGLGR